MVKRTDTEILTELHIFSPLNMKTWFLECDCLYVFLTVPECLDGFYSHSVLMSLAITGQCLVNINILAPKIRVFRLAQRNKTAFFKKTVITIPITFQQLMEINSLNKSA
jgi:hypothetical protein